MSQTTSRPVAVTSSVLIHKDVHAVFNYVADLSKDKHWRKEINETILSPPSPALGGIAIESSFLSKRVPDNKLKLKCTTCLPGDTVIYQTLPGEPFSLFNKRQMKPMSAGITELVYTIEFDIAIVKFGLGFKLPLFLVKYYTTKTMNNYLAKLKQILEAQ